MEGFREFDSASVGVSFVWMVLVIGWAFFASWLANRAGAWVTLWPYRRKSEAHWTERARLAQPGRAAPFLASIVLTVVVGSTMGVWAEQWFGPVAGESQSLLTPTIVAAALGAFAAAAQVCSQLTQWPAPTFRWLRAQLTIFLTMFPHWLVFPFLIGAMPAELGVGMLVVSVVGLGVLAVSAADGGLWVARGLGLIWPASERVRAIVARAGEETGAHPSSVWEMSWLSANAIAVPLQREIAFTTEALETFGDDELSAICLHEMGHLQESRGVQCFRMAGVFVWTPLLFIKPVMAFAGWIGLVVLFAGVWIGRSWFNQFSRKMEHSADAAARGSEVNDGVYARALERLHEVNLIPAVLATSNVTHPNLYDRLTALGVQPDYPRPKPPPGWPILAGLAVTVVVALAGLIVWFVAHEVGPMGRLWLWATEVITGILSPVSALFYPNHHGIGTT